MFRLATRAGEDPDILGNGMIVVAIAALIGGRRVPRHRPVGRALQGRPDQDLPAAVLGARRATAGSSPARSRRSCTRATSRCRSCAGPTSSRPACSSCRRSRRWGNFFNQELYGPPTTLPWGIPIDCAHRIAGLLVRGVPGGDDALPAAVPVRVGLRAARRAVPDLDRLPRCGARLRAGRPPADLLHLVRRRPVRRSRRSGTTTGRSSGSRPPRSCRSLFIVVLVRWRHPRSLTTACARRPTRSDGRRRPGPDDDRDDGRRRGRLDDARATRSTARRRADDRRRPEDRRRRATPAPEPATDRPEPEPAAPDRAAGGRRRPGSRPRRWPPPAAAPSRASRGSVARPRPGPRSSTGSLRLVARFVIFVRLPVPDPDLRTGAPAGRRLPAGRRGPSRLDGPVRRHARAAGRAAGLVPRQRARRRSPRAGASGSIHRVGGLLPGLARRGRRRAARRVGPGRRRERGGLRPDARGHGQRPARPPRAVPAQAGRSSRSAPTPRSCRSRWPAPRSSTSAGGWPRGSCPATTARALAGLAAGRAAARPGLARGARHSPTG